jgi:hypothetical protein
MNNSFVSTNGLCFWFKYIHLRVNVFGRMTHELLLLLHTSKTYIFEDVR